MCKFQAWAHGKRSRKFVSLWIGNAIFARDKANTDKTRGWYNLEIYLPSIWQERRPSVGLSRFHFDLQESLREYRNASVCCVEFYNSCFALVKEVCC